MTQKLKTGLLTILFLAFSATSFAGDVNSLVDSLQKTYQTSQSWKASFTQSTYVEILGKEIAKQGLFLVKKPGKIKITYTNNQGKTYVSNGQKFWVYNPANGETVTYKRDVKVLDQNALVFLEGLGNLRRDFNVSAYRPAKADQAGYSGNLDYLLLVPKKPSTFKKIVLGIDRKSNFVCETLLFNESGNITRYRFSNVTLNANLEDKLFEIKS